jgi:hypothetical protein
MFSDGFTTTSNFGRCPTVSLPLIASSWRPDPHVAPHIIKPNKSNVLLAQLTSTPSGAEVMGTAYQSSPNVTSAVKSSLTGLTPIVTFTVPSSACTGTFATLCFNDANEANPGTLGVFLGTGAATNINYENGGSSTTALSNGACATCTSPPASGLLFDLTGTTMLTNGTVYSVTHDDGMTLYIDGNIFLSSPGPTGSESTSGAWGGSTGIHSFELVYGECCGLPAALGTSLPLVAQTVSLPGTPDPNNTNQLLFDLDETGPSDAKTTSEGGQTQSACSNGPSTGGPITGIIPGNVTLSPDQQCTYQQCEFLGNLTINGGSAFINNCKVDGSITVIAGSLSLAGSGVAHGNVNISQAGSFNIGPSSQINGNLTIQNLGPNPPGTGPYTVCSSHVSGNISVQSNLAALQIGTGGPAVCAMGNTIGGSLACYSNANVTSGGNTVGGHFQGQCSG